MAQPQGRAQTIRGNMMEARRERGAVHDLSDLVTSAQIECFIDEPFQIDTCVYIRSRAIMLRRALRAGLQLCDIQRLAEVKYQREVLR